MMTKLFFGNVRFANLKENGNVNVESQVSSLELSKRLKELGVKQDSLVHWMRIPHLMKHEILENGDTEVKILEYKFELGNPFAWNVEKEDSWPAFTVADLGEMLPVMVQSYRTFKEHWECVYDPLEIGFVGKTEADAREKMLIYLLENKLMELPND